MYRRGLTRHAGRNHADHPVFDCSQCDRSFARSGNLEKHNRTCTGQVSAARVDGVVPLAKKRRIAPEFKLQKTCKSLGSAVDQFTVNMKEANHLSA